MNTLQNDLTAVFNRASDHIESQSQQIERQAKRIVQLEKDNERLREEENESCRNCQKLKAELTVVATHRDELILNLTAVEERLKECRGDEAEKETAYRIRNNNLYRAAELIIFAAHGTQHMSATGELARALIKAIEP